MDPPVPEMPGGHLMFKPRQPRVHSRAHLDFIRQLPCIAAACEGRTVYGVDAAHVRAGFPGWSPTGMGQKPDDARAVPLSREAHQEQHGQNERLFWAKLGVNPVALCADLVAAFPDVQVGITVIEVHARFARQIRRAPERVGGLSSPIEAAPKPVTVQAHATDRRDEAGNVEVIIAGVREPVRAFVAPDAVVAR